MSTNETQSEEADEEEQTEEETQDVEFTRATIYLKEDTKRSFDRWMSQMELDYDFVYDTDKRDRYEAVIQLAMNHEEEFIEHLRDIAE